MEIAALLCAILLAAPSTYQVEVETTKGIFVLEVQRSLAPHGAERFYELVESGYFNDSRFHRAVAGKWMQFGIAGEPKLAKAWRGRTIPDDPVRASNIRGAFAFAMTGPDTRTTQIFICLTDQKALDAQGFAPLGKVISGMDVVDQLYTGYGETSGGGMRAGKQDPLFEGGNQYLDANYPKLDHLIRARILKQ